MSEKKVKPFDNNMLYAADVARELRKLADTLDTLPDCQINVGLGVVAFTSEGAKIVFPTSSSVIEGTGTVQ